MLPPHPVPGERVVWYHHPRQPMGQPVATAASVQIHTLATKRAAQYFAAAAAVPPAFGVCVWEFIS